MSYALHYQDSSFFSYLYVCVHISLVLSHSCFSLHLTSVYTADFLSHFCKLPKVKWPGSLSSSESCLSNVFPPFLQQSWASTLPSACQCVWSRGFIVCSTAHQHNSQSWHLQSLTCDNFIRKTVITDLRQKPWKKATILLLLLLSLLILLLLQSVWAADRICLSGNNSLILRVANGRSSPEPWSSSTYAAGCPCYQWGNPQLDSTYASVLTNSWRQQKEKVLPILIQSVCCSKMFLFVSAVLNSEEVNLPSLRIKLTLQQSISKLHILYFVTFFLYICIFYIPISWV